MTDNNTIQHFELASTIESLSMIEKLIDEVCDKYGISEDHYGNILIALTEAINNAILHGNKMDPNKNVNLDLEAGANDICFTIKDQGEGFNYDDVPDPTLPENLEKINGRGVFLMKSLADDVLFEESGSCVRLKFSISAN